MFTQDQLDYICKTIKPTSEFAWFLVKYRKVWLGGKIRQVTPAFIELACTQIVKAKDVPAWKDYEKARG